jgi:hypothetical protein
MEVAGRCWAMSDWHCVKNPPGTSKAPPLAINLWNSLHNLAACEATFVSLLRTLALCKINISLHLHMPY